MTHDPSAGRGASLGAAEILRRAVQGQPCPSKCRLEAHHTLVNTNTQWHIYIYIQKNLMANGCSSPNKRWPYSYYCNMYLINPRSCWGLPNAPLHLWYWRPGCFGERCVQKLRGSVTISVIAAGFQPSMDCPWKSRRTAAALWFSRGRRWRRGQLGTTPVNSRSCPNLFAPDQFVMVILFGWVGSCHPRCGITRDPCLKEAQCWHWDWLVSTHTWLSGHASNELVWNDNHNFYRVLSSFSMCQPKASPKVTSVAS